MSVVQTTLSDSPQEALEKFDPPKWITSLFPTGKNRLKGAENWPSWSMAMKKVLRSAEVWDVVSGEELRPSPESVKFRIWTVKNTYAKITISRCVESHELALSLGDMSSYEMWTTLESMYQQREVEQIFFWIKKLGQKVDSTSAMTQHVESFQYALAHLYSGIGIKMDDNFQAGFLLLTLMNDHKTDLDSWTSFATNFPFDKTTKLPTVIASIFEEVRKRTANLKNVDPGPNLNLTVCQVLNSVEKDRRPAKRPRVGTSAVVVQKNASISENRAKSPAPVSGKVSQKRKHPTGSFSNEKARSNETVESCRKGKDRQAKHRAKAAITKEFESREENIPTAMSEEYCGMQ